MSTTFRQKLSKKRRKAVLNKISEGTVQVLDELCPGWRELEACDRGPVGMGEVTVDGARRVGISPAVYRAIMLVERRACTKVNAYLCS